MRIFLLWSIGLLLGSITASWAQTTQLNPNEAADLEQVAQFTRALAGGKWDQAKTLMDPAMIMYGPGLADSSDVEQALENWKLINLYFKDIQVDFHQASLRLAEGPMLGTWVMQWGHFQCVARLDSKAVRFPYHLLARLEQGKVNLVRIYFDNLSNFQQQGFRLTR